jgi:hypothetical protein
MRVGSGTFISTAWDKRPSMTSLLSLCPLSLPIPILPLPLGLLCSQGNTSVVQVGNGDSESRMEGGTYPSHSALLEYHCDQSRQSGQPFTHQGFSWASPTCQTLSWALGTGGDGKRQNPCPQAASIRTGAQNYVCRNNQKWESWGNVQLFNLLYSLIL